MYLETHQPDKSTWEITALEDDDRKLGSVLFSLDGTEGHIGYIGLTSTGRENSHLYEGGLGSTLLEAAVGFFQERGLGAVTGTLIPVPGCEGAMFHIVEALGFEIDRNGNIRKEL